MIQKHTSIKIVDNTGARYARCIGIPSLRAHNAAQWGDIVTVVLSAAKAHRSVKRKEIHKAIILRTTFRTKRRGIGFLRFDNNCAILLSKKGIPLAKRIYGPILDEMRHRADFNKIASLTKLLV